MRTRKRIVVLGGGMIGRLLKMVLPDAAVLTAEPRPFTPDDDLGAEYLRGRIPRLRLEPFPVMTRVDGQPWNKGSVTQFRLRLGEGFRLLQEPKGQFRPMSHGYRVRSWPHQGLQYGCEVETVDVNNHVVTTKGVRSWGYDLLLNTLPLHTICALASYTVAQPTFSPVWTVVVSDPEQLQSVPGVVRVRRMMYVNYSTDYDDPIHRWSQYKGVEYRETLQDPGTWDEPPERYFQRSPGIIQPWADRQEALSWLGSKRIHCFGRAGRWDPEEELYQAWERIQRWLERNF